MSILDQLRVGLSDRYSVVREIGMGGMATVYLARDIRHDRDVALKVLKPELGAVLGPERFLSEIRVTAKLQHPNLLPLFDSGECEGQLFYVMPFVEGESLRARLARERQLPVREAVRIASAIASALDYAHRHGVIHRDLKPENILLQEGQPLVADFGIALAVSNAGGERVTQTGLSLGTPQYMSPEQATGERSVDGRADIYSLGAVLYEMLTGEPPHGGATVQAIIARVLTETPRSVRLSRPLIPDHVDAAVAKALEKVPADRFESAKEFAEVLEGQKPIVDTRSVAVAHKGTSARRSAIVPWTVAAISAATAIAALGYATREARMGVGGRSEPVSFVLTPQASTQIESGSAAVSPDGRTIAYVGTDATGSRLYTRNLSELQPRLIPDSDGAEMPFFSFDGKWLAFFAGGELMRTSLTGGTALTIAHNMFARPAWWGRDNRIVVSTMAVSRRRSGFSVLPSTGGSVTSLIASDTANQENFAHPVGIGDGRTVLFLSQGPGSLEDDRLAVASMDRRDYTVLDFLIAKPLGYVDGQLICLRWDGARGSIVAVPFDISNRKITGDPVTIRDGVPNAFGAWLSAAGTLVYMSGAATSQMVWQHPNGRADSVIAELRAYATPRLSPNGKAIAFALPGEVTMAVWVQDLTTNTLSRLTSLGGARAEWTPDGKQLLYVRLSTANIGLWIQAADGSEAPRRLQPILPAGAAPPMSGVMAPDSTIIFVANAGAQRRNIYYFKPGVMDTARAWLGTEYDEYAPRISPDGRWLAYVSDESGASEVFVRPFPGPGARVQVSSSGGSEPVWTRDGKRIFFRSGQRLMVSGFSEGMPPTVSGRQAFLTLSTPPTPVVPGYDVSPAGDRVLLPRPVGNEASLVIVTNFFTEVRRKMKEASQ